MKRLVTSLLVIATATGCPPIRVEPVRVEPIHVTVDVNLRDSRDAKAADGRK